MTSLLHISYSTVTNIELLREAKDKITAKGAFGGVDKKRAEEFTEKDLYALQAALISRTYVPEPYLQIDIPKGDKSFRTLGLLSIADKIAQAAILKVIEPAIDPFFLPISFAYRKGKGPLDAARTAYKLIKQNNCAWALKMDIASFFDNLDLPLLYTLVNRHIKDRALLQLIFTCITMGAVTPLMEWKDRTKGIPQGAILSPLMANLYLHELDMFMKGKKVAYLRYADDFIVFCKNKQEAEATFAQIKQFVEGNLLLQFNPSSGISALETGVEFLGITFNNTFYALAETKKDSILNKINNAVDADKGLGGRKLLDVIDGIKRYYARMIHERELSFIDIHLCDVAEKFIFEHQQHYRSKLQVRRALEKLPFVTAHFQKSKAGFIKSLAAKVFGEDSGIKNQTVIIDNETAINKKKRQYEKRQGQGQELIISMAGVALGKSKHYFTVKDKGVLLHKAPGNHVQFISILDPSISISGYAIEYCAENKIPIDYYADGKPLARIGAYETVNTEMLKHQFDALHNAKGKLFAKAIVSGKITNQVNFLKYQSKYLKGKKLDVYENIQSNIIQMQLIKKELNNFDSTIELSDYSAQLFSVEGRAASYYWNSITLIIGNKSDFTGRVRQGAVDVVNVLLNYGYGILYTRVWDAILKTGLNPHISYLHTSQPDKPSLSFDIIEIFRQDCVDRVVIALVNKNTSIEVTYGKLGDETKNKLVTAILSRLHTVIIYKGTRLNLIEVIRAQVAELKNFLTGSASSFNPYSFKW